MSNCLKRFLVQIMVFSGMLFGDSCPLFAQAAFMFDPNGDRVEDIVAPGAIEGTWSIYAGGTDCVVIATIVEPVATELFGFGFVGAADISECDLFLRCGAMVRARGIRQCAASCMCLLRPTKPRPALRRNRTANANRSTIIDPDAVQFIATLNPIKIKMYALVTSHQSRCNHCARLIGGHG